MKGDKQDRAVAYMRGQGATALYEAGTTDVAGFPQAEAIRVYCEREGLRWLFVYADEWEAEGASEENLCAWPALERLAADANSRRFEVVVVTTLNHFPPGVIPRGRALEAFEKNKVRLISLAEPELNGDDPSVELIRNLLWVVRDWRREVNLSRGIELEEGGTLFGSW